MAKSRFAYVRDYELADRLLPNTYLVVRIDGHAFHKFSDAHAFAKPNDERALELMDRAARTVMEQMQDVVLAFGESDEYSFLIRRSSSMYSRRESKILSLLVSLFTSSYVFHWPALLPNTALKHPPSFDARIVQYPGEREVRDYFSWRQADTHINNLYNTTFWTLIQREGVNATEAHQKLQGTFSSDKNDILFGYGMNYNDLPARYRKGSVVARIADKIAEPESLAAPEDSVAGAASQAQETADGGAGQAVAADERTVPAGSEPPARPPRIKKIKKPKAFDGTTGTITVTHEDIIGEAFWKERPWLLQ